MQITNGLTLNDRAVTERFVRAAGPRGQNANRDATAVELRVNLATSSLPPDVKDRLRVLAGRHLTSDDRLLIVSSVFRSQVRNREGARARLVALVRRAARSRQSRIASEPAPDQREDRLQTKHRRGAVKRARRPSPR
jgi:ribosome-associated protein